MGNTMTKKRMTFTSEAAQLKLRCIEFVLQHQPLSIAEIETALDAGKNSLYPYVRHLKREGKLHISSFRLDDSRHGKTYAINTPIYKWGKGIDAKRPEARHIKKNLRQQSKAPAKPTRSLCSRTPMTLIGNDILTHAFFGGLRA